MDEGRAGAIYLWPNGLRWWFLLFALFFVFSVIFSLGPSLPNSWYCFWISLAIVVWMVWLYPLLVFYVLRCEVLFDLWGTWPPQLDEFYDQAPVLVTKSGGESQGCLFRVLPLYDKQSLQRLGRLLSTLLPGGTGYRSMENGESVQARLERVALADYFASKPSSASIWCDRGFLRWLTARCGPVVAGQVTVLGLVVPAFLCQAKEVILLILVWTVFAAGFLWHATCAFERESRVSLEGLLRLPYLSHGIEITYLSQTLPKLTMPLVVAVGTNLTFAIPLFGVAD